MGLVVASGEGRAWRGVAWRTRREKVGWGGVEWGGSLSQRREQRSSYVLWLDGRPRFVMTCRVRRTQSNGHRVLAGWMDGGGGGGGGWMGRGRAGGRAHTLQFNKIHADSHFVTARRPDALPYCGLIPTEARPSSSIVIDRHRSPSIHAGALPCCGLIPTEARPSSSSSSSSVCLSVCVIDRHRRDVIETPSHARSNLQWRPLGKWGVRCTERRALVSHASHTAELRQGMTWDDVSPLDRRSD